MRVKIIKSFIIGLLIFLLGTSVFLLPADAAGESEEYEKIVGIIKDQLKNGDISDEDAIRKAIEEAEVSGGFEISDEESGKIVDILQTMDKLGINGTEISEVIDDLEPDIRGGKDLDTDAMLDKLEQEIRDKVRENMDQAVDSFWERLKISFGEFIHSAGDSLKNAIKGLFD
jgi:uncharacterized protein YpuA (DUF1002 family)